MAVGISSSASVGCSSRKETFPQLRGTEADSPVSRGHGICMVSLKASYRTNRSLRCPNALGISARLTLRIKTPAEPMAGSAGVPASEGECLREAQFSA